MRQPTKANALRQEGASVKQNHNQQTKNTTSQLAKAIAALLHGEVSREQLDRQAVASNGPGLIHKLRTKHGLVIHCRRQHFPKIGTLRGVYRLDTYSRRDAIKLLRELEGGAV